MRRLGNPNQPGLDATVASTAGGGAFEATAASEAGLEATAASTGGLAATVGTSELPLVDPASYEMLEEFARGGLGRIVRARDRRTGRIVAIKEMLGTADETARRFAREARVTANLQHPAIVPVYELGRWPNGEPFYAMKLVAGRSLEHVLAETHTLAERLARLTTLVAVAEALAYAHGQRVIHRDLKPANVLVGAFGETVVIDWGLAKVIGLDDADEAAPHPAVAVALAGSQGTHTVVGAVLGTPYYMPPEQAAGDPADERADVYAIGAMLYHLISGAAPFADQRPKDLADLLAKVMTGQPTRLAEREPGTPPDLITIATKAMAATPGERYPSARELADDLRRFTTGQLVEAHHYDRRTLLARWLKRHRATVTVATVLLAILVIGGSASVRRIVSERDMAETAERAATAQTARAREALSTALYQKGRSAEEAQQVGVAAMYFAAARAQHDSPAARWSAAVASASAIVATAHHLGHTQAVNAVAISPDGERVASVDAAGDLRLWTRRDGRALGSLHVAGGLWSVAFSPDGEELAFGGDAGVVYRATAALMPIEELRGHARRVWSIAYAPAGGALATASEDTTIRIWPLVGTGAPRVLVGHTQRVYAIAFSADGTRLASSGDDRDVWVWDVATGFGRKRGSHTNGGVRAVGFVPGGIVSSGWDYKILVWPDHGPTVEWLDTHSVHAMAITPDGRVIATAGDSGAIHLWETSTRHLIGSLDAPGGRTGALAISRDGNWLVVGGLSHVPIVWDLHALPRAIGNVGHHGEVPSIRIAADDAHLISASDDRTIRVWNLATGAQEREIATGDVACVETATLLRDGSVVATCPDRTFRRWAADGRELTNLPTGIWMGYGAVSFDERTLVAGHLRGEARTLDLATDRLGPVVKLHDHQLYLLRHTPGGRIVTAGLDNVVKVWTRELAPVAQFTAHTNDGLLAAGLSPDGTIAVSAGEDGTVEAWSVTTGKQLARFAAHAMTIWDLVYARDAVYTASEDGFVKMWDPVTWRLVRTFDAGETSVNAIAVTADGATLVSSYRTGAIVIWDVATGKPRHRIGGLARDHGSCEDYATLRWLDDAHRAAVAAACASEPSTWLASYAARSHQRIDREVDVVPSWPAD